MDDLFQKNAILKADVKRNILSLKKSEDLFDDLYSGELEFRKIAQAAEARVKRDIPTNLISRGFHYTTSILYPFQPENYQKTRYNDGSFACWYGACDLDTTIHETAFHNLKNELGTSGVNTIIERDRAIYNIFCEGILLDLRNQEEIYPQLIAEDYSFTQQIGRRLSTHGHPGLLAPSARKAGGINVVVFSEKLLSNPRLVGHLTYYINPLKKSVRVEKEKGKTYIEINFSQVF